MTVVALEQKLIAAWRPYPDVSDRAAWSALPDDVKSKVMKGGERTLGKPYAPLPASLFLEYARNLLDEKHLAIEHVDAVVILERPKLGPHFPKMREALAKALRVPAEKIHLKAKTNEGVDAVGRGEAIAAHVVATLST